MQVEDMDSNIDIRTSEKRQIREILEEQQTPEQKASEGLEQRYSEQISSDHQETPQTVIKHQSNDVTPVKEEESHMQTIDEENSQMNVSNSFERASLEVTEKMLRRNSQVVPINE